MYGYKRGQVRIGQVHDLYMLHVVNIILFVFKHNTTCQLDGGFASYGIFILQLLGGPALSSWLTSKESTEKKGPNNWYSISLALG